jgi:hypothetical protein
MGIVMTFDKGFHEILAPQNLKQMDVAWVAGNNYSMQGQM